jgi:hypothetical protein
MIRVVIERARRNWAEADWGRRATLICLVTAFAFGVLIRSMRYWVDPIALWGDEALWASRLLSQPVLSPSFRPLGFMAMCRGLVEVLSVDERVLRLPSYVASIASLWLFRDVAHRVLLDPERSGERPRRAAEGAVLLLVAVAALHPMLVDFAKEFKPYAVELCVHLLLMSRWLAYLRERTPRRLAWVLALAPLSFFFAYNVVFLYPTLFGTAAVLALRARQWRRLAAVSTTAVACLTMIASAYWFIFRLIPNGENDSAFWGQKYGVFYLGDSIFGQAMWSLSKYVDLVGMPGVGRLFWQWPVTGGSDLLGVLTRVESMSWAVLYSVGVTVLLFRRRSSVLLSLTLPVATVMVMNVAGLWPWGAFRTNLFLLAYVMPVPFVALAAWQARGRSHQLVAIALTVMLHLLPQLVLGFGLRSEKRAWTGHSEMPRILQRMREERERRLANHPRAAMDAIYLDSYTCEVFRFYLVHHTRTRAEHAEFFKRNFRSRCTRTYGRTVDAVKKRRGAPTWVIVSKRQMVEPMLQHVRTAGNLVIEERPSYNHLVLHFAGARPGHRQGASEERAESTDVLEHAPE